MLRQRVITALAMAGLFLAGIFYLPLAALAAVFALVVAAGAWEWAPLAGLRGAALQAVYALLEDHRPEASGDSVPDSVPA